MDYSIGCKTFGHLFSVVLRDTGVYCTGMFAD